KSDGRTGFAGAPVGGAGGAGGVGGASSTGDGASATGDSSTAGAATSSAAVAPSCKLTSSSRSSTERSATGSATSVGAGDASGSFNSGSLSSSDGCAVPEPISGIATGAGASPQSCSSLAPPLLGNSGMTRSSLEIGSPADLSSVVVADGDCSTFQTSGTSPAVS